MRLHLLFTSNIILAILAYFQISKNEVYTHSTSDVYTMEFVKVAGTEFLLNNKIWKPVGFNTYLLIEQAAELPYGSFNAIYSDGFGKKEILKQFEQAIFLNFTCVRTWFYSINSKYPLFIEDKVYDERLLGALDWVTAAARAHGLKLILSFTDFWPENGGIASLMLLSRKSIDLYSDHSEQHGKGSFFTDQNYFTLYIRHIEHLLLRRSKITGTRYCDESTVMAWELMVSLFFNIIYIIYLNCFFLNCLYRMNQDVDCVARAYCKSGYLVLQRQLNRLIRGTYLQLAKRVSMHQQKVMLIRLNGQVILARILYLIIYLQKLIMHRAIYGQTTGIYSLCGIENGWKMVV